MTVQVLYFGVLKEFFGSAGERVELADGARVSVLLELLRVRLVAEVAVWGSLAVAVNREYAGRETVLRDGDEVALLPPVSGGSFSGATSDFVQSHVSEARHGAPVLMGD